MQNYSLTRVFFRIVTAVALILLVWVFTSASSSPGEQKITRAQEARNTNNNTYPGRTSYNEPSTQVG